MKYVVTIGGRSHEVVVDGGHVEVEGKRIQAELRTIPGTSLRQLILPESSTVFVMVPGPSGQWLVQDRGERYEVEALDERTHYIRGLVGAGKSHTGGGVLKAPMPGLVVRLMVEPGQAVVAGQGILVLEAMKMENELKAAGPGVIERIDVTVGQAVEKGQLLMLLGAGDWGSGPSTGR
ncbi:MAG: biotin/lipoyl-containing protein [Gemmatimonadota bacterium]|nr:biotin/lipoyl-containing protein [Gemmatimonadota bacterium]